MRICAVCIDPIDQTARNSSKQRFATLFSEIYLFIIIYFIGVVYQIISTPLTYTLEQCVGLKSPSSVAFVNAYFASFSLLSLFHHFNSVYMFGPWSSTLLCLVCRYLRKQSVQIINAKHYSNIQRVRGIVIKTYDITKNFKLLFFQIHSFSVFFLQMLLLLLLLVYYFQFYSWLTPVFFVFFFTFLSCVYAFIFH